ncbi:hypothetical protein [Streptomyces resistomycificus]|uniref:hypothetical protein n=1 Tax=Streptomyces resistomycificus TaxID=67356 RepID=UPI000AC3561F|nr:hypothetical protein [Streptomyces resistomycificus]
MTSLPSRAFLTACAVTTSALLLTACTSDSTDAKASPSHTPTATATAKSTAASEKKLTEQVEAALAGFHNGSMVESGVERVSEGIHTEPLLKKGETYRLNLACAGTGSAQLLLTPASAGDKATVPCDGSVVQQRLTADKPVRIDVNGNATATGMIAWQIDKV